MSRMLFRVVVIAVLLTGVLLLAVPPGRDDDPRRDLLPWSVAADGRGGSTASSQSRSSRTASAVRPHAA